MSRFIVLAAAIALTALPHRAPAQRSSSNGPILTLEEAQRLARVNNPEHQQVVNNLRGANAAVRSAYGALLPSFSASLGTSYQQGGRQVISGAELGANSDVIQSSYSIGASMRLNSASFITPKIQKASRDAVEADITSSEQTLRATVTQQYLSVLQAEARASLQDTLVASAQAQLGLAQARVGVGAGTALDIRRSEVALGQAQVAAIQAHNTVEIELLRLFQRMGVPQPADVRLTTTFQVNPVDFSADSVLELARRRNPIVEATRSRERIADLNLKRAKGEYSPSFSLSTGWGGYTYQYRDAEFLVLRGRSSALQQRASCISQDSLRVGAGLPSIMSSCQQIDFDASDAASIRAQNSQYPFDFTANPRSINASISMPLFDGFAREQRLAESRVSQTDARHQVRSRELALTADVTAAYLTLTASVRTVALQEQNAVKAREELAFVQERYRVGSATYLELVDSRALFERAESERINAIYDYHKAFAALESAVGSPLR
jgi:outer membrane protein